MVNQPIPPGTPNSRNSYDFFFCFARTTASCKPDFTGKRDGYNRGRVLCASKTYAEYACAVVLCIHVLYKNGVGRYLDGFIEINIDNL